MPTFKQLSDYYANYIRTTLTDSILKMINCTTRSEERRTKLVAALIVAFKEINKNLNQYCLSDSEKDIILSETAVRLGLQRINLFLMLEEASKNDFGGLMQYWDLFFEEFRL